MLTTLAIENFRGIQSLSITDLGRVNIFIGDNGAGKTSILESILLTCHPTGPQVVANLAAWREMPGGVGSDAVFSTLFYKSDKTLTPKIDFTDEDGKKTLIISSSQDRSGFPMALMTGTPTLASTDYASESSIPVIQFTFMDAQNTSHLSRAMIIPNGVQQIIQRQISGGGCFYIHARRATSIGEMSHVITDLTRLKTIDQFVSAIKSFDGRVKNITAGYLGAPTVLVDVGDPILLPVNVLGDGFCRTSLMITGLFEGSRKLVVDEIDSGLHVSAMDRFWQTIGGIAREKKKQVFCTTHSEEMLASTIDAFSKNKSDLRIFRIDRTAAGKIVATKYDYDEFFQAKRANADIR